MKSPLKIVVSATISFTESSLSLFIPSRHVFNSAVNSRVNIQLLNETQRFYFFLFPHMMNDLQPLHRKI